MRETHYTVMQDRKKKWLAIVLFNLLIASLAGLLLRGFQYDPIAELNYMYILHGHSHFAFAGWGFMALFLGFYHLFIPDAKSGHKTYSYLFVASLITAWGMLLSFPFQGYAAVSITFSTLYILVSFWFAWKFYKDTKEFENTASLKFLRASLFFLVLSSLGPLAMGPIMATGQVGSPLALNAIYFYMHFQYNGWFIFGIAALFFKWLEIQHPGYPKEKGLLFFRLMFWSCLPAYLISVLWNEPIYLIFVVAGIAALAQLVALIPFFRIIRQIQKSGFRPTFHKSVLWLLTFVLALFVVKRFIEFSVTIPAISEWALSLRPLIIGYLHMVVLGVVTLFLFSYFIVEKILPINTLVRWGLGVFVTGFVVTETLLLGYSILPVLGIYIPDFNMWMYITTALLPAGIDLIWIGHLNGDSGGNG